MNSWTIIILGASGDLARHRLIPALYQLIQHHPYLPFVFIGAAKEKLSIEQLITESVPSADPEILKLFIKNSSYVCVDFNDSQTIAQLVHEIDAKEKVHALSGNRLVYFSLASPWYAPVTQLLNEAGIIHHTKKRSTLCRVVYEKPFGWDTESAQEINKSITTSLDEEQIYRVDHYLSKSLVTSLLVTRFSNTLFEPLWNKDSIDQVQLLLTETDTIDGRGLFYDQYGALKDVVQNHIFELLTSIAMERPPSLTPELISRYKREVLDHLMVTDGLKGQYSGYTSVPGVAPNSTRETYALLKAEIKNSRWHGVPFIIKAGKAVNYKSTEIHIVFKPQSKKLINQSGTFEPNRLIFRISPDSAILLRFMTEKGHEHTLVPLSMEFCYRCTFSEQPHSYETLFYDIIKGDKSIAVPLDEIIASWNCISQINLLKIPLFTYLPGSSGPAEAESFTQKYGILWDQGAALAESGKSS